MANFHNKGLKHIHKEKAKINTRKFTQKMSNLRPSEMYKLK